MNAPLWQAADLAIASGGQMSVPFAASGVSIDTRSLAPGDLFVALPGTHADGHDYVALALAKGAAGAMVARQPVSVGATAPLLVIADPMAGLVQMAKFARARAQAKVLAVTGSVGKTTTKEMLRRILAASGPTHVAAASYNNQIGVPLTLARLPEAAAFCVLEIGMNHAGEIAPLARLARPHVGVITAIEKVHIGHLGSTKAIADEKAEILAALEPGGIAVLPGDSPVLARLCAHAGNARILTFGATASAGARLIEAENRAEGVAVLAQIFGELVRFELAAPGRHMALNAVGALAAAAALGIAPERGAAALAGFSPLAGRGERRQVALRGGTALLLDECYNASAPSVRAALAVLALQPAKRHIAVLGDMLELGEEGVGEHVSLARPIAQHADLLFACGPLMRHAFEAVAEEKRGAWAADAAALAPTVAAALEPGDAVLVKGSLGSAMARVVAAITGGGG